MALLEVAAGGTTTGGLWRRYAPHVQMVLAQLCYTLMYFITEAAFNQGLNPYVYITYRHLLVAVLIWPFAYYHEKGLRPKMTFMLFMEIFVLSLLGYITDSISLLGKNEIVEEKERVETERKVSLTLNMYFASLKYTSPTFVTSVVNTIASMTFVIAIILRMEIVDVKSLRGVAKIAGTVVSFAGVTTMTLYKGAAITSLWKSPVRIPGGGGGGVAHDSWVKGSVLAVASCICWSIWYIMQASSLKRYPAQLSLTAWMCTVGGIQSTVFTLFMQHRPEDWRIGFGVKFWSIVYSGLACNGFTVFVQLWCTEKKGPVFVTMFNPLSTIMVAILAYFIFGENLYVGSIIGGGVVILGLYMLLWGKEKDQEHGTGKEREQLETDCEKQAKKVSDHVYEAPKTAK